ncbi:MAG: hypothetical protein IKT71_01395 [Paludibacteraceae bacterium]|nr:hypothetical protein [Paludibacteraceae bacterium]
MKTLRNLLMCAVMLLAVGCDKEDAFEVTPQMLAQTVWDAEIVYYDENDNQAGTNNCVVEFLSETEGKYNEQTLQLVRPFTYSIDRSIIVIDSGNYTTLSGTWHIIEKSEQKIVLQRYSPNKTMVTLNRLL